MKKVLVIGGGGRCHAIVDALSRSKEVEKIYCAPGNGGISAQAECVPVQVADVEGLLAFAKDNAIDLTIVGPEASLAAGVVNEFRKAGLRIFGPTREAARIESSKEYAKDLMARHGVPTASYRTFSDFNEALEYVKAGPIPVVIKYDGLAAGKGVVVALTYGEAEDALRDMLLDQSFGEGRVVIEEFLDGPEFSFMCLVNGDKVYPLDIARDHKRAYDNDKGPNTGGMGAYSPVPFVTEEIRQKALDTVIRPVAEAMKKEGVPFTGVLYGGLILHNGTPKVIEFNARFGDPETEVVLPRLASDFYALIDAAVDGRDFETEWIPETVLGVVLAAKGYPGKYEKGYKIEGLEKLEGTSYHMGTAVRNGELLTVGGRVMMVTAKGTDLAEARKKAYEDVAKVDCSGLFHRTDIGAAEATCVVSGKDLARDIKQEIAEMVPSLVEKYGRAPHLAVILVGEDPASQSYVKSKGKDAEQVGYKSTTIRMPETTTEEELLAKIAELNADDGVDGILVQLPVPRHIDEDKVIEAIDHEKDVDGFHPMNVASLWQKRECVYPCTPKGIIRMLEKAGVEIEGKRAVVIGRSNIVGLPMAKMLLDRNATVTIAHSRTKNLAEITRQADILVAAVGRLRFVTEDMVAPGAVVIDVGVNRDPATGKLAGDVDYARVKPKASVITPVPGGVGPMTRACLMENTLECYLAKMEGRK